jgi:hypothetical protein
MKEGIGEEEELTWLGIGRISHAIRDCITAFMMPCAI